MQVDELLAQALNLPRHERALVAEALLASLEEPADRVAVVWATELEQRSKEVARGGVELTPWETVHTEIRDELERRRTRRSPP